MSLFYKEEHATCYNSKLTASVNFTISYFKKSDTPQVIKIDRSVLFFVLSGEVSITCNQYKDRRHRKNELTLMPRNNCCYIRVVEDATVVSCAFLLNTDFCNRFAFLNLTAFIPDSFVYDFTILPVRERVSEFFNLLIHCLEDGIDCMHFHELKQKELFILLRAYYSKEELATFFYPLIGKNPDFKDFVMSNYLQMKDLAEFASKANMSLPTFKRHFQEAFGVPAYQWITERKSEWIYKDILLTDIPFNEIGEKYHFSSLAYFSAFCKKHFGLSPQKIRDNQE